MRTLTFALLTTLALNAVAGAQAADLDYGVLRGPDYEQEAPLIDWNGVYFGGHGGYTSAAMGFANTFQPLVANALRATSAETIMGASTLLSPQAVRVGGGSYGAFAGFNYQFDEAVVGLEVDYTRFERGGTTTDAISRFRTTGDGFLETVSLSGLASTTIQDYGTIRARGGWALGNLLPFVTGGLAIGRAQVVDHVSISNYGYDQTTYKANAALTTGQPAYVNNFGYASFSQTNPAASRPAAPMIVGRSTTKVVGGIALGGGIEYALTSNILLRGEYQYVLFNDFNGHKVNLNTVRGGAAVKF
ncbi:porin [Methylobacterium sp. Leaf99]|jgi:opacity protein-like surface antigen|uniref:outer membrane protein n=1 Tax=unclassified Methylobacterium TaxID=2615210 RepID=UPI0006F4A32B|nr:MULTISPECIES: outer membrane beta-barrel protein [unclassified Methylobacterium]KQP09718.1 porin [Methylobacterium sp. Leaf99]TXM77676.1 porin family protein [Methylobacterium sp. WL69]